MYQNKIKNGENREDAAGMKDKISNAKRMKTRAYVVFAKIKIKKKQTAEE